MAAQETTRHLELLVDGYMVQRPLASLLLGPEEEPFSGRRGRTAGCSVLVQDVAYSSFQRFSQ